MPDLETLIDEAKDSMANRGHRIIWTDRSDDGRTALLVCQECLMDCQVRTRPAPNQIDIGGEAVAIDCRPERKREIETESHVGHYSRLTGQYWCDTCNSPYCDLA